MINIRILIIFFPDVLWLSIRKVSLVTQSKDVLQVRNLQNEARWLQLNFTPNARKAKNAQKKLERLIETDHCLKKLNQVKFKMGFHPLMGWNTKKLS